MTDPFDYANENPSGFCKYTLTGEETVVDGDKWKEKIKTGVVVDLDEWVAFTLWARTQCAKTNNECVKRK